MQDKKLFFGLFFLVILAAYFLFSFHHLSKFVTADEHYWLYERIPQYWNAIADGNFKKTMINDKPGISIALISGTGLLWEKNPETLCTATAERIITCDTARTKKILLAFRLPLIFTNFFIIIYLFWITKKLTNEWIAVWNTILIAFSPILLGISQIVNPDSLLWSFGMAAILSYFALLRYQEKKYIFFSGIFVALTLLTKYVAGILIPFFILTLVFWSILKMASMPDRDEILKIIRRNLYFIFFIIFIAISFISILLPAIWLKPIILQTIFSAGSEKPLYLLSLFVLALISADIFILKGKLLFFSYYLSKKITCLKFSKNALCLIIFVLFATLALGRFFFPDWNLFERIPFDLKELTSDSNYHGPTPTLAESILLEINPLVFSLSPIAFFLFLLFLLQQIFMKNKKNRWELESFMLLAIILIYFFILIFFDILSTPRYIIMLYPVVSFLASIGAWNSREFIKKKLFFIKDDIMVGIFITFIILTFSLVSLLLIRPFYANYANFILPKKNLISSAWGYGGYEAAQYLNSLPNASELLIWSDYEGVCEFFKGNCMVKQYEYASAKKIDYAVITRRGKILYNPDHIRWQNKKNLNMAPAYKNTTPDWSLEIDGRPENFIKAVKVPD